MLDKDIYEKYLRKVNEDRLTEKGVENLTTDCMNLLIQYYIDKQYMEIQKELNSAKRFRQLFEKQVSNRLSYYIGGFSILISFFEVLTRTKVRKDSFKNQMTALYAKAGVKEVLEYIYKNPDSQHKTICEMTSVKNKSYLSQLLKQLETAGCVERYSGGKTSFFSLSIDGQAFVKDKIGSEKKEIFINPKRKYDIQETTFFKGNVHKEKYDNIFWNGKFTNMYLEVK